MADKHQIIQAGIDLWRDGGESAVSARRIAARVGMTHGGVLYSWSSAEAMRSDIASFAVKKGDAVVIRRLIVDGHSAIEHMDQATKNLWLMGA